MKLRSKRLDYLCKELPDYDNHAVYGMVNEDDTIIAVGFIHRVGACMRTIAGADAGSAGGTRWILYNAVNGQSADVAALTDGLRLARGMSYKFAALDIPIGGGKIVVFGHNIPGWMRTEKGRVVWPAHVQSEILRGIGECILPRTKTFITAEDMGVNYMMVAELSKYAPRGTVAGCAQKLDPSPVTARGVRMCAQTAIDWCYGLGMDMRHLPIMIQGVGSVGSAIAKSYWEEGVRNLSISDTVQESLDLVTAQRPGIIVVDPRHAHATGAEIFMPCAGGAILNKRTVADMHYRSHTYIICGCANNQLATPDIGQMLHDLGIVWCPDYLVNAGGLIEVTAEMFGRDLEEMLVRMRTTFLSVLYETGESNRPTSVVADDMVSERVAQMSLPQ